MENQKPKKTPLYEAHKSLGANIVDFHGWLMPLQYESILAEHEAVRARAGLFDVSHMGEIIISGALASEFLDILVTNNVKKQPDKKCTYTPMCLEDGGIIDDLIVYRHSRDRYMLVVNASNLGKDLTWILSQRLQFITNSMEKLPDMTEKDLKITDISAETSLLALQGPKSQEILEKALETDLSSIKRFSFADDVKIGDSTAVVSRTGYTGEDGFEIYLPNKWAEKAWEKIMQTGKPQNIMPAGLGARDTLRIESALMLYGADICEKTTPLEAGLDWTVKLDKEEFIGKKALEKQKKEGLTKKMTGVELSGRGVLRGGCTILKDGEKIGQTTSGTYSPTLKKSIALAYIQTEHAKEQNPIQVELRGKTQQAKTAKTPFYKR
jgi:aminomethyltransferase